MLNFLRNPRWFLLVKVESNQLDLTVVKCQHENLTVLVKLKNLKVNFYNSFNSHLVAKLKVKYDG